MGLSHQKVGPSNIILGLLPVRRSWAFSLGLFLIVGPLTNDRLLHFECGSFLFKSGYFVNDDVLNFKCVSHSLSSTIGPPIIIVSLSYQCLEF